LFAAPEVLAMPMLTTGDNASNAPTTFSFVQRLLIIF